MCREAQRIDPDFAMAYWGEAMTRTTSRTRYPGGQQHYDEARAIRGLLQNSPLEGGPIHLMGLLLRDLFVDRRLGVWGLILTPYTVVQLLRLFGAAVGVTRSRG